MVTTRFRVPKKITPDPIKDSIVEIRFKPAIPKEAVFGIMFKVLGDEFPYYESGILPKELHSLQEFNYYAEGKLRNDKYSVGIGSNVIVFNCVNGYKGWSNYFPLIKRILKKVKKAGIVKEIDRLGIRYINLFENVEEISEGLNLEINFRDKNNYETKQTAFRTQITKGVFHHTLSISDKAQIGNEVGMLIDIDTFTTELPNEINDDLFNLINKGKREEKILFYKLLKEHFVNKFNPEY